MTNHLLACCHHVSHRSSCACCCVVAERDALRRHLALACSAVEYLVRFANIPRDQAEEFLRRNLEARRLSEAGEKETHRA